MVSPLVIVNLMMMGFLSSCILAWIVYLILMEEWVHSLQLLLDNPPIHSWGIDFVGVRIGTSS